MIEKRFGVKKDRVDYKDRIGAYAIILHSNKLATVKIPKGNFLIGGKVEEGESYEECIIRESLEETGYEVKVNDFVCKSETYCFVNGYYRQLCYYYLVDLKDKVVEPIESDHQFEWVDIDKIDSEIYLEHQKWAIKYAISTNR